MQNDLAHITKQIQANTVNIEEARRQAQNQRMLANQHRGEEGVNAPDYYEQQAQQLEAKADGLQDQIEQLNIEKEHIEQRIHELEQQREQVNQEYDDRLTQIDKELTQLRGSGYML